MSQANCYAPPSWAWHSLSLPLSGLWIAKDADAVHAPLKFRRTRSYLLRSRVTTRSANAGVGLYAVLSYTVVQRTRQIGIRMALGARPGELMLWVSRGAVGAVGLGLVLGWTLCGLAAPLISDLLYQASPFDPTVAAAATVFVVL